MQIPSHVHLRILMAAALLGALASAATGCDEEADRDLRVVVEGADYHIVPVRCLAAEARTTLLIDLSAPDRVHVLAPELDLPRATLLLPGGARLSMSAWAERQAELSGFTPLARGEPVVLSAGPRETVGRVVEAMADGRGCPCEQACLDGTDGLVFCDLRCSCGDVGALL